MLYKSDETGTDVLIKTLDFFLSFLSFSDFKILLNDTLDGSLSLPLRVTTDVHSRECVALICSIYISMNKCIGVCFNNKCYIVTFQTRRSCQTSVSVQQAILFSMYRFIAIIECHLIDLRFISNDLSKRLYRFPKEILRSQ